jgi:hypothetical protein
MTHILTLINDLVLQWCQGEQIYNYISYLCTEERNIPSKNRSKNRVRTLLGSQPRLKIRQLEGFGKTKVKQTLCFGHEYRG